MTKIILSVLGCLIGYTNVQADNSLLKNHDQKTLTFVVVPQQSASKLASLWIPVLNALNLSISMQK